MKLAKKISLANGLTVCFYHHTHRYFGDYHRIRVEIICEVPVTEEYFETAAECAEARAVLGGPVVFRRNLEMMGIPGAEVERCLDNTIENFTKNSLSYLLSPSFPRKLVLAELAEAGEKGRRVYNG